MPTEQEMREHVAAQLRGGQAYDTFDEIVGEFPPELRGRLVPGAEHSAWQILEHMRFCQRDILEFTVDGDSYTERKWPDDYWTPDPEPPTDGSWDSAVHDFLEDQAALIDLVNDPANDLVKPFPWGDGQTLLREALLAADHASYHLGQLVELRRFLK